MSRIGRKPITVPSGVTIETQDHQIVVRGPKGELKVELLSGVKMEKQEDKVVLSRVNDEKQNRANHGLIRSLVNNAVAGVTTGYKKTLKLLGTGYRVSMKGAGISLAVGFSHPVDIAAPAGIKLSIEGNDTIYIEGIDKQLVGQVAANIRKVRPPEPYKGKGIRYEDEVVRRKQGKAAA
ncbi:MAG TPA: 50S ribosomal protein L6 [Vitreimonas sp.]|nr:50S ribosomal protein L6 [Vitreimonas sp.]